MRPITIPGSLFQTVEIAPGVDFTRLEEVFVINSVPDTSRAAVEAKVKLITMRQATGYIFLLSCLLVLLQTTIVRYLAVETIGPDIVLIWIVYLALREGQATATTAGFFLGLAVDLLSGSESMIGLAALSKTMAGFTAGFFYNETKAQQILGGYQFPLITAVVASLVHNILYFIMFLQGTDVGWLDAVTMYGLPSAAYTAALTMIPMFVFARRVRTQLMTHEEDIHVYTKRRVLHVGIAVIFILFIARLYQLQLIYKDEYGKKSEENSIRTIPKEPIRGNMYDRNGRLVVDNRPAFTLTIMPFEFDKKTIPFLASLLRVDPAFLQDRLKQGERFSRFQPVKVLRDLDFRTLSAIEENRDRLPGVDYQIESKRFYTTRANASHILGYAKEISEGQLKTNGDEYVQGDVIGSSGLEAEYERVLRGKKGAEFSTVNVRGQVVGSFNSGKSDIPSVAGEDLKLTMDFGVQELAESLMTDRRGSLVAIDPETGGIIAMVSKPDYDLNLFSGVVSGDTWRALNNDPDHPLYNRATLSRYPPGSTFKPLLALAALENNIVSPSWRIYCNGVFPLRQQDLP